MLFVSGSVGYDPLKKLLYARCSSIAANMATIRTVLDVLNKESSNYSDNIHDRDNSLNGNIKYNKQMIIENNRKYKNELKLDYYLGAFPNN